MTNEIGGGASGGVLAPHWEYVADTVMGGVSTGRLSRETVDGRAAVRLRGQVSLDNNGGFIQMAFDLRPDGRGVDLSDWRGIEFDLRGNGASYDIRLRTDQLSRPWQSFRTEVTAPLQWRAVRVAFADLIAHRTEADFDPAQVRRIGVLAVGRAFEADVSVAAVRLYQ
jgi:adhesin HecA-like repeat protein